VITTRPSRLSWRGHNHATKTVLMWMKNRLRKVLFN
jgi:hypothetical protein